MGNRACGDIVKVWGCCRFPAKRRRLSRSMAWESHSSAFLVVQRRREARPHSPCLLCPLCYCIQPQCRTLPRSHGVLGLPRWEGRAARTMLSSQRPKYIRITSVQMGLGGESWTALPAAYLRLWIGMNNKSAALTWSRSKESHKDRQDISRDFW
jgi:hypothetical protein